MDEGEQPSVPLSASLWRQQSQKLLCRVCQIAHVVQLTTEMLSNAGGDVGVLFCQLQESDCLKQHNICAD